MSAAASGKPRASAPPHVPEELIRAFDFDAEPGMNKCPHAAIAKLHEGPRIFYNTAAEARIGGGAWVPTRIEDLREILQTPEVFSAKGAGGFAALIGETWDLLPVEKDPPEHGEYRALLNPLFAPPRVKAMEDGVRARAVELIEAFRARGSCDLVAEFAKPFPISIILQLLGLPSEKFDDLVLWATQLLHGRDLATKAQGCRSIATYLRQIIAERRAEPKDDLISYFISCKVFGRSPTDDELLGIVFLLFGGGVDTVAASLGFYFKHLADHPDVQDRLRADPALIPNAVEEFLRSFAIVTSTRRVVKDVHFKGVEMKAGDWVSISTQLACLDPDEFSSPLTVDIDRSPNRHQAFSFGVHRCVGSHLARREIAIALEEFLARIPRFRVADGDAVQLHGGNLMGVDKLQLVW
ncbi:MAG: cytochrome P450 [Methylocystis sp.]